MNRTYLEKCASRVGERLKELVLGEKLVHPQASAARMALLGPLAGVWAREGHAGRESLHGLGVNAAAGVAGTLAHVAGLPREVERAVGYGTAAGLAQAYARGTRGQQEARFKRRMLGLGAGTAAVGGAGAYALHRAHKKD